MPQSALPVSFDSPQLMAKSPAIKTSVAPVEESQPRESFAEHLQKTQEAAKPVKQKTSLNRSDDVKARSDNHLAADANKTKGSTKDSAINTQDIPKDAASDRETLVAADSSIPKADSTKTESIVDSETDESALDLSNLLLVEEDIQPVAGDLLSTPAQVIATDLEAENYSQLNLQPLELSTEEIPDQALLSKNPLLNDQQIMSEGEGVLVAGLPEESEALIRSLSDPTQTGLNQTALAQQGAVVLQPQGSLLTATPTQANLSAIVSESFAFAKDGKDLPADTLVTVGKNTEVADAEMSLDDLFLNGDQKNSKVDQFKLVMGQIAAKEQAIPAEKPAPTSLILGSLHAVTNELTPASRLFVPQTQLGVNVQHPQWGRAMGEKILWMANQQLSSADIRLDPPELGSLQIKITVQQDQASITFITPHPQVRELLDQQAVRLRELFADQGLNLNHLDIADGRQQSSDDSRGNSQSRQAAIDESEEDLQESSVSSLHLVDLHA